MDVNTDSIEDDPSNVELDASDQSIAQVTEEV